MATAEKVDPGVIIFNPIAGHWHFKRAGGGLHPDESGDIWIARHVAEGLVAKGVTDFNSQACLTGVNPVPEIPPASGTRLGGGLSPLAMGLGTTGALGPDRKRHPIQPGCTAAAVPTTSWGGLARLRTAPLLAGPSAGGFGAGQTSEDGSKCGRTDENDHHRAYDY